MSDASENDPDVQANGFRLYADTWNIPDAVLETFLDERFDPQETWAANQRRWWRWFVDAVPECPRCGEKVTDVELAGDSLDVLRVGPCGHTIEPDVLGELGP